MSELTDYLHNRNNLMQLCCSHTNLCKVCKHCIVKAHFVFVRTFVTVACVYGVMMHAGNVERTQEKILKHSA